MISDTATPEKFVDTYVAALDGAYSPYSPATLKQALEKTVAQEYVANAFYAGRFVEITYYQHMLRGSVL